MDLIPWNGYHLDVRWLYNQLQCQPMGVVYHKISRYKSSVSGPFSMTQKEIHCLANSGTRNVISLRHRQRFQRRLFGGFMVVTVAI